MKIKELIKLLEDLGSDEAILDCDVTVMKGDYTFTLKGITYCNECHDFHLFTGDKHDGG